MTTKTFADFTLITDTSGTPYLVGYQPINGVQTEIRVPYSAVLSAASTAGGDAGGVSGAAAALPQVFATYSALQTAITAGQFTAPRSVVVTTDETNDNTRTFYNWDGAALQWAPTVDA